MEIPRQCPYRQEWQITPGEAVHGNDASIMALMQTSPMENASKEGGTEKKKHQFPVHRDLELMMILYSHREVRD